MYKKGLIVPDQETYGRFIPGAWNFMKLVKLTGEEQYKMRLMIEAKTETIKFEETKSILYAVVSKKNSGTHHIDEVGDYS